MDIRYFSYASEGSQAASEPHMDEFHEADELLARAVGDITKTGETSWERASY